MRGLLVVEFGNKRSAAPLQTLMLKGTLKSNVAKARLKDASKNVGIRMMANDGIW